MPERYREPNKHYRRLMAAVEFVKRGFDVRYALYRLRWNYAHRYDYVGNFPVNLDIEPTEACNLKCIMCPQAFEAFPDSKMIEVDFTKQLIDQAAANGTYSIKFTWRGEPAIHKGLVEMVRYAKDKGIPEVQFTTNGTPFTERKIRDFIRAGLDRIIFSMDGASKETVETIRAGIDYERTVENIKMFHRIRGEMGSARPFIRVQMVRMKANAHEVDAFMDFWKHYADDIQVADVSDRGQGGDLAVGDQVPVGRTRCPQPWQRMVVASNGDVVPCCADWRKEWVVGNAKQTDLKTLWRSAGMEAMRQVQRDLTLDDVSPCDKCFVRASFVWERPTADRPLSRPRWTPKAEAHATVQPVALASSSDGLPRT